MRKIYLLLSLLFFCVLSLFAQAPEKFTYQAVVRNATNQLVINAQVGVRVNILQGSASGDAVYSESHVTSSNANGLITVNIGGGSVLHGSFTGINWSDGPYFLKTDIDPNGGNEYSITSVQQLLSVPYALYANEAANGFSGDYNDLTNRPQIPQIPTDVSAFNNDAGYITAVQVPAQVNADWNATSGAAEILNKPALFSGNYNDLTNKPTLFDGNYNSLTNRPNLAEVAISGSYNDLMNKPTIPAAANNATLTIQRNESLVGTFTADASTNTTINIVVPTTTGDLTNNSGFITAADIPEIPTNVSQLNNDAGYLTTAQCGDVNICDLAGMVAQLQQQVAALQQQIDSLQGQSGQDTTIIPIDTTTTPVDTTTNPIDTTTIQLPTVTTSTASNITSNSAMVGGNVTSDGGATVTARGVCWSTNQSPTIAGSHISDGGGTGDFINTLAGLTANTTYYVRAYATNSEGTAYGEEISFTTLPLFTSCGVSTVTDYDGNIYTTVQIGNQCWMKENLRTTHYANGDSIGLWGSENNFGPHREYPRNITQFVFTYGYLYNWLAVMHDAGSSNSNPSGVQGICPNGWHVPSEAEWTQLTNFVAGQTQYTCDGGGTDIAKALSSTGYWHSNENTCAVGNDPSANNKTGFSAIPTGTYYFSSDYGARYGYYYQYFGKVAGFWSATEYAGNSNQVYLHLFSYDSSKVSDNYIGNVHSLGSVRCLRDEGGTNSWTTVTTAAPTDITATSATCGGIVTVNAGGSVAERGICWSASPHPTTGDSHINSGSGTGNFTCDVSGLTTNTTYYVRAYVINNGNTAYGDEVTFTTFTCGVDNLTDYDGNTYNTVQIGNQCWMRENLRTTQFADGRNIPLYNSSSPYSGCRSLVGNSLDASVYGYLYNFLAMVDHEICPPGWHVPNISEWVQLINYVKTKSQYICGESNNNIAKAMASQTGWNSSTNSCAVGNTPSTNNATLFSAFPAGYNGIATGEISLFGSITEYTNEEEEDDDDDVLQYWSVGWNYDTSVTLSYICGYNVFASVRCIRDVSCSISGMDETSNLPTVTTSAMSGITDNSATCGGNVTSDGGASVTARGVCWSTSQNPTVSDSHTTDGSGTGNFTSNITGLTAGTTYYVRAYATNSVGTAYGTQGIFMTSADIPSVTTLSVSNETATTAISGGIITSDGGASITARGVCWSTSQNPTVSSNHTTDGSGAGSFTSNITGLTANTTYYVRAYATNSAGTAYGNEVNFTTADGSTLQGGQPCPGTPTVTDHEGNVYNTVQIGNQCWMRDNLRTTTSPSTGTYLIPAVSTDYTYTGKQALWYNNDPATYASMNYGLLYNWNAAVDTFNTAYGELSVNTSIYNAVSVTFTSHRRGICPAGWHLPSNAEWTAMTDYVSSQSERVCGGNTVYIAKALADSVGWNSYSGTCNVGNDQSANNATGFSAVPAGLHRSSWFSNAGDDAYFWSSSQYENMTWNTTASAYLRHMYGYYAYVGRYYDIKADGYSVRCLRD